MRSHFAMPPIIQMKNRMMTQSLPISAFIRILFLGFMERIAFMFLSATHFCNELQEFFKNKTKSKLSDQVSHNCRINEKQIDGRELEGKYILEIRKHSRKTFKKKSSYRYTQEFNAKVIGRYPEKKHGR